MYAHAYVDVDVDAFLRTLQTNFLSVTIKLYNIVLYSSLLRIYVCMCMHICIYVCVFVCMCVYVCMCACVYVCERVYVCVCVYVCM